MNLAHPRPASPDKETTVRSTSVAVVIPVLDEVGAIREVIGSLPAHAIQHVIVADGGSSDGTARAARDSGADVVVERRPGYGRACAAGAARAAELGADVVVFVDGSGCDDPADVQSVLAPVLGHSADLVIGSRTRGAHEPGSLGLLQRAGNELATRIIAWRWGTRLTDLGPMRAIRTDALEALALDEPAHGWPAQMVVRALEQGLRIEEVPVRYRRRRSGRSKVSGDLGGAWRAGRAILRVVLERSP